MRRSVRSESEGRRAMPRGARTLLFGVIALATFVVRAASSGAPPPVEARLDHSALGLGESASLEIIVRGNPSSDPEFDLPRGLEMLGSGRIQNFSWVNGKSSSQVVFRYELGARQAGRFSVGPFRVRLGSDMVSAPAIDVTVTAAATSIGGSGTGAATLIADIVPHDPYVGQPVILRVRLVQRAQLAEDPQYIPPATPGFWSEAASRPESYYAAQGNQRVLVTETRTRLYPLATGTQTVGEATAHLALLDAGTNDPSLWLGGQVPRREVLVRSAPVAVHVRALPGGASTAFDGAVGALAASWSSDRDRTARDVPATVRLDLRGVGNLPLIHAPRLESEDFEIFSGPVDDSLGVPGSSSAGRRTFQWTVLPRREGALAVPAPALVWFDPVSESYRSADLPAIALEVGPAINASGDAAQAFPLAFAEHPLSPGHGRARPWMGALGGCLAGAALLLLRRSAGARRGEGQDGTEAMIAAVERARGADFWHAAETAMHWLEARGVPVESVRAPIAASRFGGAGADPAPVRRAVLERLVAQRVVVRPRWPVRLGAASLALAGVALGVFSLGLGAGSDAAARDALRADAAARTGDVARARTQWLAVWKTGARDGGLAARLGWAEVRGGEVGPASAWVLAGEVDDPRDGALEWVRAQVREAGGLTGAGAGRIPLRRIEWAVLAFVCCVLAGALVTRSPLHSRVAVALALAALGSAALFPLQTLALDRSDRAVIRTPVSLAGTPIELESGQVVRILAESGRRVRIAAGRGVDGWVSAASVYRIGDLTR